VTTKEQRARLSGVSFCHPLTAPRAPLGTSRPTSFLPLFLFTSHPLSTTCTLFVLPHSSLRCRFSNKQCYDQTTLPTSLLRSWCDDDDDDVEEEETHVGWCSWLRHQSTKWPSWWVWFVNFRKSSAEGAHRRLTTAGLPEFRAPPAETRELEKTLELHKYSSL
jgi:hypothetical protein